MATYSSNLRLTLIASGADAGTWGNTTNYNLGSLLEGSIAGMASVSVVSVAQALTANNGFADESREAIIELVDGGVGAAFAIFAPPVSKTYAIRNTTAYDATIYNSTVIGNTTPAGTGVLVKAGATGAIFTDGTSFYAVKPLSTLPISEGGTGQTTQQAAINALVGSTTNARFLRGDGANATMAAIQAGDVPTLNQNTTGSAGSLATTNWTVSEFSGSLYFAYGGINKMRLDSSGNLVVVGNVTAYGTP